MSSKDFSDLLGKQYTKQQNNGPKDACKITGYRPENRAYKRLLKKRTDSKIKRIENIAK